MKLDRQEVVALLAALDGWFDMDHEDRLNRARSKMSVVRKALEGVPNVETRVAAESNYLRETLHVVLGPGASKTARQVAEELDAGDPRIKLGGGGDGALVVVTHTLRDGEEAVVADRLRAVLVS
jgi:seryl-tRNA(Sec) selenium transferase